MEVSPSAGGWQSGKGYGARSQGLSHFLAGFPAPPSRGRCCLLTFGEEGEEEGAKYWELHFRTMERPQSCYHCSRAPPGDSSHLVFLGLRGSLFLWRKSCSGPRRWVASAQLSFFEGPSTCYSQS